MDGAQAIYLPDVVGKGYGEFWNCKKRYRVVKGGKASKKSSTAALWYILHLMKYPEANLLVVRQVGRTHRDSTFAQLRWAIERLQVSHLWRAVREPLELQYIPTGQKILFRGFDNVEKLASTTVEKGHICWVWVEEAFEIAREADFDKLDLSLPRGRIRPPLFKQTTLTFNPWDENHWLKARFFDQKRGDTLAMTTNYTCNEFLDSTDLALYEEMKRRSPRRYAVAGLGEWGKAEGLIFDNWEVQEFDANTLTGERYRHIFGLDYGYTNDPTAFIAAAEDRENQTLYIYDEYYARRMLNADIANMLTRKGYAKERIRADSAEPKSNEDLRRLGITRLRAAEKGRHSVNAGIARLQEYHIVVHPGCVHTAAELAAYAWEPVTGGQAGVFANRPQDSENHLMDALRYAIEDLPRLREGKMRIRDGKTGVRSTDLRGNWGG
jgi:phage terminase large subunit